jgi:hypothetical protein
VELDSFLWESRWHPRSFVSHYKKPWWKNPPRTQKFHPSLLGRRNKRILKTKRARRNKMIMEVKRNKQA